MYNNNTIQNGSPRDLTKFNQSNAFSNAGSIIETNWEAHPLNSNRNYNKSPACKHQETLGSFSAEKHLTRTFNRKLKMKDTFTSIFPNYNHNPRTVFNKQMLTTQTDLPLYVKDQTDPDKPIVNIDRHHTHKVDVIKHYSEEMYKLGVFAPQPIKGKN